MDSLLIAPLTRRLGDAVARRRCGSPLLVALICVGTSPLTAGAAADRAADREPVSPHGPAAAAELVEVLEPLPVAGAETVSPEVSTVYLSAPRFQNLETSPTVELEILQHEILARHGHSFRDPELRQHFAAQPWYEEETGRVVEADDLAVEERVMLERIRAALDSALVPLASGQELPPSRRAPDLAVGSFVRVRPGLTANLRGSPEGEQLDVVSGDQAFEIIGGPQRKRGLTDTIVWWRVIRYADGREGWVAANTSQIAILEPMEPPDLTGLERITWEERDGVLEIVLWADGKVHRDQVNHLALPGERPRELIRIKGVERGFRPVELSPAATQVLRIRVGHHPRVQGDELHIVLDLQSSRHGLRGIEIRGPMIILTIA